MKAILILMTVISLGFGADIYGGYSLDAPQSEKMGDTNQSKGNVDYELTASFFTQDYFTEIKRYAPIFFDGESMDGDSQKVFDQILEDLNNSDAEKSRITIIGNTAESVDTKSRVDTNWFVNFFQNVATHEGNDAKSDINLSKKRGEIVYQELLDSNVSKKIMFVAERGGKDKLYSEGLKEGRNLNNRVDIALYIIGDKDRDGVLDPYDRCPGTHAGLSVDKNGCSGSIRLDVLFKLDSAIVDGEDNGSVKSFASFLIKNPPYDARIVGHTDTQGRAAYNMGLSERRAEAVMKMLVDYGVGEERLKSEGKGLTEPLVNKEDVLEAKNEGKEKVEPLTREELQEIYATNRRIEAHYFLRPEPVVEKKKPKAPRLRLNTK